jgi:hypothetical protein
MEDLHAQAQLVALDRAGAIGTVVARAEIAEAAAGPEFPATFILDLDRVGADAGADVTAHASVAVDWDRETLEQILASTEDNQIELWFDERELAPAFDDVEGHGLRERAAVLAVAVVAAGAAAAPSLAAHAAPSDGGAGAAAVSTGFNVNPQASGGGAAVQPAGAERALLQDENIAVQQTRGTVSESAVTSSGGSTLSSGELAAIAAGGGALLITAAGFGATRKRQPPVLPA